ncbi:MAG: hypothetical protein KA210_15520 [Bacteroidia bacterium]|nr:hypothetical protein [Bacteroidia bacterium]
MKSIILVLFIFITGCNQKIENKSLHHKVLELVISEGNIGQKFIVKQIDKAQVYELEIVYLGKIEKYKIVFSTIFSGKYVDSKRANSYLYLFDNENNLVGYYYVGGKYEKSPYVLDKKIILPPDLRNDCKVTNQIDLSKKIPSEIFIDCKDGYGDLYKFDFTDSID